MAKFFRVEDVPIKIGKKGAREKYPFSQLQVGQSVRITIPVLKADRLKLMRSLRAAVTNANIRYAQQGSRFGVDLSGKHYRIGRLK